MRCKYVSAFVNVSAQFLTNEPLKRLTVIMVVLIAVMSISPSETMKIVGFKKNKGLGSINVLNLMTFQ